MLCDETKLCCTSEQLVDVLRHVAAKRCEAENERELLLDFVKDVWLNKYPTKPRAIAAAGRLLDKLGER